MELTSKKQNPLKFCSWGELKRGMSLVDFSYFSFILLLLSFTSCDKDEDVSFDGSPYYLGYFEGVVNNQDISIRNQSGYNLVIDHGNFWQETSSNMNGFYWEIPLKVNSFDSPYPALKVSLTPLRKGKYMIDKGKLLNGEIGSTVRITKDDAGIVYHPLKSPFKIQVDSIRFHEGSAIPYIEGKMEGVLYNMNDMQDSITIKSGVFGIH